jgi:hypothetical protein
LIRARRRPTIGSATIVAPKTIYNQSYNVNEIIFLIEDAAEGGFTARALGESIFTAADTMDELRLNIREAVDCHFEPGQGPKLIRLHYVREEVLPA